MHHASDKLALNFITVALIYVHNIAVRLECILQYCNNWSILDLNLADVRYISRGILINRLITSDLTAEKEHIPLQSVHFHFIQPLRRDLSSIYKQNHAFAFAHKC